ncbi:HlyD family secretion protein [Rhodopseudomonas sp. WA056]|uniref:Secretion protein HlyD family protein n=1 Tax=Rhodopseudomonas palustris (strain DX-1) TaxID=652103 RepID=E6VLR2_RHOPX|nr:HlyD family secretion protein [Rhodopseudomonas sp. WA056]NEW88675.1 HlyD family secretion protein [Rhodopseudomonas sp. WA056]
MSGRDQAARALRPEPGSSEAAPNPGVPHPGQPAAPSQAETLRSLLEDPSTLKLADPPEPETESEPIAPPARPAAAKPPNKKKFVLIGVGIAALAALGYFGTQYMLVGRFMVGTDDAYVRANNTTLGARVSGHLAAILPRDNSEVKAGDVVFRIDDGDYKIAVASARAKIATQEATIARIGRQIAAQQSAVEQAQAQLESAEAAARRAALDFDRQQALSTKGFASRAVFETSQAGRDQTVASVAAAKAAYDAARDGVEVTRAQQAEARAQLVELQSSLAKAERDLDFTQVRAPVSGVFSNRLVNLGDFINAGQRMANIVPLHGVYIDANFKETQLRRLKPGQKVNISVDAYSSRKIEGVVDSLSPAAGQVFTLLPPDNATGNFTKIVQRVPVRIRVPAEVAGENLLRAGMSVYVDVDTRTGE